MFTNDHSRRYDVVRNDEGQYSVWPAGRTVPSGWTTVGTSGSKSDCLAHIRRVWTDQRPKSLRLAMGA